MTDRERAIVMAYTGYAMLTGTKWHTRMFLTKSEKRPRVTLLNYARVKHEIRNTLQREQERHSRVGDC